MMGSLEKSILNRIKVMTIALIEWFTPARFDRPFRFYKELKRSAALRH